MMVNMKAALILYILADFQTNKRHTNVLFSAHELMNFYSKRYISFEYNIKVIQANQVRQDEAVDF